MKEYSDTEIKQNFKEFLDDNYSSVLLSTADKYPDERSIYVKYNDMVVYFGDEFPAYVLEKPSKCLRLAEEAALDILGSSYDDVHIHIRVRKLPPARNKGIRELRAGDLTNFIAVDGLVRKATEVRPRLTKAVFQCVRCNAKVEVEQVSSTIEEPIECSGCGKSSNKTNFMLLLEESEFQNYQNLEIQESPEGLRGGDQPQRLKGWIEEDLVGEVSPGDRITLNGILDGDPKSSKGGAKSRTYDIFMRVNSIDIKEYEYEDIKLSEEDKEAIKKASEDPKIFQKIVDSISRSIQGLRVEKTGLALQLFGGVRKKMPDQRIRGDIHILLVGDPGTAKSQLLRYISDLSPRGMYASGKGSTGAGLTAAAIREEIMGESKWTLEAGTLVLADKGIAAIDELDKMREEDRSSMHEAMEQQSISVAKAGINARLNSRCAILGAANPQYGRFEEHQNISQQIKLPAPLISRFDLIFALLDKPNKEKDRNIADHILRVHHEGEKLMNDEDYEMDERLKAPLEKEFLRKYIAYAKKINPEMTAESISKLQNFYIDIRQEGVDTNTIPITARQLESLVRMAEASARAHLRDTVTAEDSERAIRVTKYFLNQVASTEGGFDIDMVAAEVSHSERTILHELRDIIRDLDQVHEGGVPVEDIKKEASDKGISGEQVNKELKRMKREGMLYNPKEGRFKFA
ncbi:MAG: minichromosome maintenance protein MCM [Thermoplasmata archaeon]